MAIASKITSSIRAARSRVCFCGPKGFRTNSALLIRRVFKFQRKARLEVSGIRKGSQSIIQSRVKMKLEQISPSDTLSPGYVCVVEFGTPCTRVVEKCKT